MEGSARSWNSSPSSTDALAFPAYNQAATSQLSSVVSRLLIYSQADTWIAAFSLGSPPHSRPLCWPSLLLIKLPHQSSTCGLKATDFPSSRHLEGSLQSWISSPTSTDALAFPAFNQAATSPLSYVVSRLLMLLKQTPGRQSSVLDLLPNLD